MMRTYVRCSYTTPYEPRPFGPKPADHPSCGEMCVGCRMPMSEGSYTTLIPVGPGGDHEAQVKARNGRTFNAVALELHWTCVTGLPDPEEA